MGERLRRCTLEVGALDLESGVIAHPDGTIVALTLLELRVLRYLAQRIGQVVSLEELYREVWGYSERVSSRAVDKTASRLRKKMERDTANPVHLLRVPGSGLRLEVSPAPENGSPPIAASNPFIGRAEALETLGTRLQSHRLVTLVGPGGVGKSRLAKEYESQCANRHAGGCFTVNLDQSRSIRDLEARMARALSIPALSNALADELPAAIASCGEALFILHSPEGLLSDLGGCLARWLAETSGASFLVTSRRPLGLLEEQQLRLKGLPADDAASLFETRTLARYSTVRIPDAHRDALHQLVTALEGNPLAIELASARAGLLTVPQLLEQLSSRFKLLRADRRERPERHRSLRATIAWSWDLLTSDQRSALEAASVFAGPFSLEAAEDILQIDEHAWILDVLQALVDSSMVTVTQEPVLRFKMGRSVQVFAQEALGLRPEGEATRARLLGRLARHYAGRVAPKRPLDESPATGRKVALAGGDVQGEVADLENLMVGATQDTDLDAAVVCCRAAFEILRWRGPLSKAEHLVELNLGRSPPDSPATASLLLIEAILARLRGDWSRAEHAAQGALERLIPLEMPLEESSAHLIVGLAQMEQGHPEQALTSLRAAHEIRSRLPNHELEQATTLANLGFAHLQLGQADQALDAYKAALERYQVAGDRVGEGVVLDKLCGLHWTRGELERSKWYGCRALEAHRRAGNQRFEAIALGNLGTLFQELGELTEAAIYFEQAQDLHEAQGNRIGLCVTAAYLGSLATERENWEEATAHLDRALRLARALGAPPLQARALLEWGAMELAAGKLDIADALLAEASQLARDTNRQGLLLAVQGLTASQRGRADVACARLEEAKAIADTLGTRPTSRLGRLIGELRAACESSPSTTPGTGPG